MGTPAKSTVKAGRPSVLLRLPALRAIVLLALTIAAGTMFVQHIYGSKGEESLGNSQGQINLHSFKNYDGDQKPADNRGVENKPSRAQYNHDQILTLRQSGGVINRPDADLEMPPRADGLDRNDDIEDARDAPAFPLSKVRKVQFNAGGAEREADLSKTVDDYGEVSSMHKAVLRQKTVEILMHQEKDILHEFALQSALTSNLAPSSQPRTPIVEENPRPEEWMRPYRELDSRYSDFLTRHFSSSGHFEAYSNSYGNLSTNGTVFIYHRNASQTCLISKISLKYTPGCYKHSLVARSLIQVLVLGIQRSGTHVIVGALKTLGIDIRHEGVGVDGGCGWPFVSNIYDDPMKINSSVNKKYIINNKNRQRFQRYRVVLHQVRHPLAVIRTLLVRAPRWDRFWHWISKQYYCSHINVYLSPPVRAMLLYLCWNEHIERQADRRYQIETTSARDVCTWAGFPSKRCHAVLGFNATIPVREQLKPTLAPQGAQEINGTHVPVKQKFKVYRDAKWPEFYYNTTWDMLEEANKIIAQRVKKKCLEYGYLLDPP